MSKARMRVIFCLIVVISLTLVGQSMASRPQPASGEITLTALDNGRQVELATNDILTLRLESNPSTGYFWEVQDVDETVLRQVEGIEGSNGFEFEARESSMVGGPGTQILRFAGVSKGYTTINLVYHRPWERAEPLKTYSVEVKSGGAYRGSFSAAKAPVLPQAPAARTATEALPSHWNWCDEVACTPVKDQGSCGSCWAFGTLGPLEQAIRIFDGVTVPLSEQFLVSCNDMGLGCGGGTFVHKYLKDYTLPGEAGPGAVLEADFPYQAADVPCGGPYNHPYTAEDWAYVDPGGPGNIADVESIKEAIYQYGPVSGVLCADDSWANYDGGIWTGPGCSGPNHAILITGWDDAGEYWFIRNSWGPDWGESGYMRMRWNTSMIGWDTVWVEYEGSGPTPPAPPSNLAATVIPPDGIDLTWQDNSTDETGFEVQRNVNAGPFSTIATLGANVTGYSDTGLTPGTYCYRARSTRDGLNSAWSDQACATIQSGDTIFADDFGTNQGWVSDGGTATTGQFERGDPQPTSYSEIDYQIDAASPNYDLVTGASAGSGVGDYDIDSGDTRFRSPDIYLPGSGDISLSFNYYLAHYSNSSSDDYLRVKVVGSSTQTILEVLGTASIKGAAWQSAEASLNAFAGQTVYLLVEAADAGSGSLIEAAIDDVLIVGSAPPDPPAAPSNLAATAISENQIDLTWQDNSTDEGGFDIQRKTGTGSFATIATVGADVTAYSDTGLTSDTTYTYRVQATKGSLVSGWSNEASATTLPPTPPAAPSNLAATAASQVSINLSWTDNASDEDGFEVQRKTGSGSFATVATLGANVTAYSDTGLAPGTTYDYRVRATKGSLVSGWSNEDSATTLTGPVFEDDFETDKGWTSAGGTATTGQFERANPDSTSYSGVTYQLDAASASYDLVTGASAGSSVGDYDIDGGDTRFRSPDIALPDQSGLTLSFSYYLAHYSNASSDDYLTVKVVGNTTQTVLDVRGSASIKGGAWQSASVNLDAFAGQTIYLLVEAADAGSGSLVEAGLDDVLIE